MLERKPKICLLIPVYNHSRALAVMLPLLKRYRLKCILVDDASSPGEAAQLAALARKEKSWVKLFRLPVNQGKGGAVLTGVHKAVSLGYSHALQIDADGQHDPRDVPRFVAATLKDPAAVVCGTPIYDQSVPFSRRWGRQLTNVWIWINTLSFEIKDGMCGYRLYRLMPVMELAAKERLGQRMDFDTDLLVRLKWEGTRIVTLPVKVRYPLDGTSHFKMFADNVLISLMHTRLFFGMLARSPQILRARWRSGTASKR